jgi:hypothetical protein
VHIVQRILSDFREGNQNQARFWIELGGTFICIEDFALRDAGGAYTPAFEKLRNPVLRRTVARITTLRQAASVGGVSLGEIIGRLRVSAGQVADLTGEPSAVTRPHRAFLLPSPSITTTGVGPSLPERGHFHPDVQRLGSGRAAS